MSAVHALPTLKQVQQEHANRFPFPSDFDQFSAVESRASFDGIDADDFGARWNDERVSFESLESLWGIDSHCRGSETEPLHRTALNLCAHLTPGLYRKKGPEDHRDFTNIGTFFEYRYFFWNRIERQNGLLREWCKRLTRLAYAFSLASRFAYYNFCPVH
jgi:hypothetical protein